VLRTFVYHPRELWLRRALFQVHLWAGVLLSLYVMVIALTGSILVFRAELTRLQLPSKLRAHDAQRQVPVQQVVDRFQLDYPGAKLASLQTPSEQLPVFVLTGTDSSQRPLTLLADPSLGALIRQTRTWLDWVYDLHVYLLLGQSYGMQVNGIGSALLLLITASGLYLWWPGVKLWTRGLRMSFKHNWRRIAYDAHNAIGFWTVLLVTWWAVSGAYFGWYRQVTAVVSAISPLQGMRSPSLPAMPPSTSIRTTLPEILASVEHASPHGHLFSLSDPELTGPTVYALVDRRAPGDFSHRDIVTMSTQDARVLTVWHYGENHTAGDRFLWAMHPLHFGTLWGLAFKALWALAGVALALLSITGLLMYWNRFLRHRVHART
jgi:uncharacterized iron-regulated membrane protein